MYYILTKPVGIKRRFTALGLAKKIITWQDAERNRTAEVKSLLGELRYVKSKGDAIQFTKDEAELTLINLRNDNPAMVFIKKRGNVNNNEQITCQASAGMG